MKKSLLILAVSFLLMACGGGSSAPPSIIPIAHAATTTEAENNFVGLNIRRGATASDGYSGGLSITRDTTGLSGGTPGAVNTASFTRTITSALNTAFEWASLSIIDNHASAGENVAAYAQGNKHSTGPTWGAVSQVIDYTTNTGSAVIHEFDLSVRGADTGNRVGLDVVLYPTSGFPHDAPPVGSSGVRVGGVSGSTWTNGLQLTGAFKTGMDFKGSYQDSVIKYTNNAGVVVFEVKPNGDIYRRGVLVP